MHKHTSVTDPALLKAARMHYLLNFNNWRK